MQKTFEDKLRLYNEAVKKESENTENEDDSSRISVGRMIRNGARDGGTNLIKQNMIYDLQKKKADLMEKMKEEIKKLDDPESKGERKEGEWFVVCKNGKFFTEDKGEKTEITLGDIMTDGDWGIKYYLDPETVPRKVRKRYIIACTKREISELLNQQLSQEFPDATSLKYDFESFKDKKGLDRQGLDGKVAELLVRNYLAKLAYDHNLDFRIEWPDSYNDAVDKIDFMIKLSDHSEKTDTEEKTGNWRVKNTGIQFTIIQSSEILRRKVKSAQKYLSRLSEKPDVDDLILLSIPVNNADKIFETWLAQGKHPGGPDRLLSLQERERVFKGVLLEIFPTEKLDEWWSQILPEEQNRVTKNKYASRQLSNKDMVQIKKRYIIKNREIIQPVIRKFTVEEIADRNRRKEYGRRAHSAILSLAYADKELFEEPVRQILEKVYDKQEQPDKNEQSTLDSAMEKWWHKEFTCKYNRKNKIKIAKEFGLIEDME